MTRILTVLALTAGFSLGAPAFADEAEDELAHVRETVAGLFSGIDPQDIFPSRIDGWYTVRKGAIIAYISADGRYLLQGDLIDLEQQVNLTEEDRNDARVVMMKEFGEQQLIVFSPENVRHSVSVFTDIDCTFCRRLHAQIDEYLAEGIEIRYFLYPRNGPASDSWGKAERVWCANDRNEALTLAKLDRDFESRDCDSSMISSHYTTGQDVGLRGTPAIVLEDGTLFSGYLPPKQLAEAIESTLSGAPQTR